MERRNGGTIYGRWTEISFFYLYCIRGCLKIPVCTLNDQENEVTAIITTMNCFSTELPTTGLDMLMDFMDINEPYSLH